MRRVALGLWIGIAAHGAVFEVASVKVAAPWKAGEARFCSGGPGTSNPVNWTCRHQSLAGLIFQAYDLELYEYQAPDWMAQTFLDVAAKVPAGTTREQFREMQKNLLVERFHLQLHRQPKEMTVYEIVVAKSGLKMRESAVDVAATEVEWSRVAGARLGPDRWPEFPEGTSGLMGVNGRCRWRSSNVTMADIVRVLRRQMNSDVADGTGLKGKYDIDMRWQQPSLEIFPATPPFEGPTIEKAMQDKLGLRLESKKGTVGVVVIDSVERTPVEN